MVTDVWPEGFQNGGEGLMKAVTLDSVELLGDV